MGITERSKLKQKFKKLYLGVTTILILGTYYQCSISDTTSIST